MTDDPRRPSSSRPLASPPNGAVTDGSTSPSAGSATPPEVFGFEELPPHDGSTFTVRLPDVRWRILLFSFAAVMVVAVLVDLTLVRLLPVSSEMARFSRLDVLLISPVVLAVAAFTVFFGLRRVHGAVRTLRRGLRLTIPERQNALRSALNFPVVLALVLLGAATLGNLVAFIIDLLGRSPCRSCAVHSTLVGQCLVICACFPLFVYARAALRPVVRHLAGEAPPPGWFVSLRLRIGILIATLCLLVSVPAASMLSLQLDRQAQQRRALRMRSLAWLLAHEADQMGLHSFHRFVARSRFARKVSVFTRSEQGIIHPAGAARRLPGSALRRPAAGRPVVVPAGPRRRVAVAAIGPPGATALLGIVFDPRVERTVRWPLVLLTFGVLIAGVFLALLLGGGVAHELRAIGRWLRDLGEGRSPEPLPGDTGSIAEIGRVVEATRQLLDRTDLLQIRGFVAIEASHEASRTKTQFLADMSHDLRAPLTALIGYAEFLAEGMSGSLNERQARHVRYIRQSALHLQLTIDELLDTAKLEAGRLRLSRGWTPPATVISRGVQSFAERVPDAGKNAVKVEIHPGLPPIYVDPERTGQIISHLLTFLYRRAMDPAPSALSDPAPDPGSDRGSGPGSHTEPGISSRASAGPQLTVTTSVTDLEGQKWVQFRVADSRGHPLADPDQNLLDERVETTGQRRLRLGPALAAQLTRRQKGHIEHYLDRGKSAGFTIRFGTGRLGTSGPYPVIKG